MSGTDLSILDRLHAMLTKAGISDEEIMTGIRLTQAGMQKVAARFGIAADEVPMLINSLVSKLRREQRDLGESYKAVVEGKRFSYEGDILGNVTVRDAETGREVFLQGSEAAKLRELLRTTPDEQAALARFAYLMEDDLDGVDEADSYDEEIRSNFGTYNFPWRADGQHGTATASYRGRGNGLVIKLVDVRDADGEPMEVDQDLRAELVRQARDFIGEE